MITWATVAIGLAIASYWFFLLNRQVAAKKLRPSAILLGLVAVALLLVFLINRIGQPAYTYTANEDPIAIAIAFDLSPSMLAIPDPGSFPEAKSRFERGLSTLNELLRRLEENQENILVSVVGFTKTAEVIMGWENDVSQIQEILQYVVSPDLFTSTGTSMEAAVKALAGTFGRLPQNLQEKGTKIAILVSDGEDTTPYSYMDYVVKQLESGSFDMIALQAGWLDISEGVPRYGEFGDFMGFQMMGGRFFTVPDTETMHQMANSTSRGLYVRAESQDTVERILDFIGSIHLDSGGIDGRVTIILGLFLIVSLLYARLLM